MCADGTMSPNHGYIKYFFITELFDCSEHCSSHLMTVLLKLQLALIHLDNKLVYALGMELIISSSMFPKRMYSAYHSNEIHVAVILGS
jgi:hypothetical protein